VTFSQVLAGTVLHTVTSLRQWQSAMGCSRRCCANALWWVELLPVHSDFPWTVGGQHIMSRFASLRISFLSFGNQENFYTRRLSLQCDPNSVSRSVF
jgi:hypothetical protein